MTKNQEKLSLDKEPERIDLKNINFFDLLAQEINHPKTKAQLVMAIISGIGKNDPAALKIMQTALEKSVEKTQNKAIPILGGITQKQNAIPGDNRAPQNPQAPQKA